MIFAIPSPRVEAIVGVDDAALIILASLAAFGIAVTASDGINDVGPWVTDQFEEYVNSVGDSLSNVWGRFRSGVTKAGQLVLDGFTLRYNAGFGEWLVDKFSLSDNDSVDTGVSDYFIGDIVVYPVPQLSTVPLVTGVISSTQPDTFLVPFVESRSGSNTYIGYYIFCLEPFTAVYQWSSYTQSYTWSTNNSYSRTAGSWKVVLSDSTGNSYSHVGNALPLGYNFLDYLSSHSLVGPSVGVDIGTGSISVPGFGDYGDDDGILIGGLGSWGDSLDDVLGNVGDLTLPGTTAVTDGDVSYSISAESDLVDSLVSAGELTTENSPGFYNGLPLIGGIPDIQFGNLWHYVTDWVGSMSGGLALIGGIMFSLPFVAAFYALVVILLVLSLWRLLRSA